MIMGIAGGYYACFPCMPKDSFYTGVRYMFELSMPADNEV